MQVAAGHRALARPLRSPAIAIGNFDGVHRGHLRLFEETIALAARRAGESVVLTFDPHPARVLSPRFAPPLITNGPRKLELIEAAGIDACVVERFDRALAALAPEEFVGQVLVDGLGAVEVCVGYDFTFGRDRQGDTAALAELGRRRGFGVTVIEPFTVDGIVCSSTKVREFVLEGQVEGAALLLGRDVEIEGPVVRGAGRGRTIGVPTANVLPETELLPRGGVYAGWALLDSGARFDAAINVGTNPTFESGADRRLSVEAHLLDFSGPDLYGVRVRLGLAIRLRDELRFSSVEALVEQIRRDIAAAADVGQKRRGTGSPAWEGQ